MNNAVLEAAVVDSSAIMSIFEGRASAAAFRQALKKTVQLFMSAGTLMELSVIFIGKKSAAGECGMPLDETSQQACGFAPKEKGPEGPFFLVSERVRPIHPAHAFALLPGA